ncbi:FAD/NAD(P)-binding domain-containing protein [Pyrenochaeta sp. DS3sAY3a]|nr:FAD/NAD(P)-binding domain-containing protein [Pyrenochaeta sp. DS3sAY3a]
MGNNMKVLIIGTGTSSSARLEFASAKPLPKNGIDFEIFERRAEAKAKRHWGVTVHWAVEFLALYPEEVIESMKSCRVLKGQADDQQEFSRIFDGATGEHVRDIPQGPAKRFNHSKIRGLLASLLPIQYEKHLIGYKELPDGVEAQFSDGTKSKGTLLIGSDGSHSAIRKLLFEKEEDSKWNMMPGHILNNFWMSYTKEQALAIRSQMPKLVNVAIHPNGAYFGLVPLDIDDNQPPEEWVFQVFLSMKKDIDPAEDSPELRYQIVKEVGPTFVAPFNQVIEWMPKDTFVNTDRYGTWETKKWDHRGGKVILAGDSAHSMTPHRAQGFNHALQDVLNIIAGLKRVRAGEQDQVAFVDAYVEEVAVRGSEEVRMSLKQGYAVHNWGQSKDLPTFKIGTTPLHMKQSIVPLPSQEVST